MSDSGSVDFGIDDSIHVMPLKINQMARMPNKLF